MLRGISTKVEAKHKVALKDGDAAMAVEQLKRFGVDVAEQEAWKQSVLELYEEGLKRERYVDLSDLVLRYLRRLGDGTIEPFRADFLHVDEYQDTDSGQLDFVLRHAAAGSVTTIVGDDDQAIYSFRSSLGYQGVLQFEEKLGAKRIILTTNYRSRAEIVDSANQLVSRNLGMRIEKQVHAERGPGGKVRIHRFNKREDEAANVRMVLKAQPQAGWAVITRNNADLIILQMELIIHEVPFIRLGPGLVDSEVTAALMTMLRCVVQERDMSAPLEYLLCALGAPMADANLLTSQTSGPLGDSIRAMKQHCIHPSKQSTRQDLESWLASFGVMAEQILDTIALLYNSPPKSLSRRRTELNYISGALLRLSGSINQRITTIERGSQNEAEPSNDGRAVLLTAHASKGMEFNKVWVMQVSSGTLPSQESAANIWEERRLLFVAMTRAKDELVVSYSDTKSVFIDEVIERG